jgi:hypothetical protein
MLSSPDRPGKQQTRRAHLMLSSPDRPDERQRRHIAGRETINVALLSSGGDDRLPHDRVVSQKVSTETLKNRKVPDFSFLISQSP